MIPTIDYDVFEWRMVMFSDGTEKKEKVFADLPNGCLATDDGTMLFGYPIIRAVSRPIEKKILPLESAFDIPSWCFGCTIDGVDEHFYLHIVHKDCVALSRAGSLKYVLLPELAEKKAYIEREGFGRFNLYLEVEE